MTEAFFQQEWAHLEDAVAGARNQVTLRCKHTAARLVFDAQLYRQFLRAARRPFSGMIFLYDTLLSV